jgi:uncharacterized protein (TIGR03437 family)
MIVAGFGLDLAAQTVVANTVPLPLQLAGTSVRVRDSQGVERQAPLFFVAPAQVNYLMPAGTAPGYAHVTLVNAANLLSEGDVTIAPVAPGLFAANANGHGVAAAVALRVKADGAQSYEPVAQFDASVNQQMPTPLDLDPPSDQVFLILFGTGIRGRTARANVTAKIGDTPVEVLYAGAQGLAGLDQLNLRVPRSLSGKGEVKVALIADGLTANQVKINIK